jgi:urea transport system ATP-binding protein
MTASAAPGAPLLYLDGVTVSFDGFKALNGLSFMVERGELRSVIGPNGAGKTTMMDVITGKTRPDEGKVFFDGTVDLTRLDESEIANLGIGRKFQKPTVFENLTVLENLELAQKCPRGTWHTLLASLTGLQREAIDRTLETIGLSGRESALAGALSHGQKQWLEIGMLLIQDPELLMLDEPVAGMSVSERVKTAALLNEIIKDRSVIVIEHDMKFVASIAHRVTVLHQGKVLAEGDMLSVQNNPKVKEVYLGH